MDIRQVSVTYREEQDRILVRINTAQGEELRLWFTRRLVLGLWPVLNKAVVQAGELAAVAAGRPAPADQAARQAIGAFEREAALSKANFTAPYQSAEKAALPLGAEPLLVSEVRITPHASGALQIAFQEKLPDLPTPRGFQLELRGALIHGFTHLLEQAIAAAQWRAGVPGELAEPDTGPGPLEPPRRYLN
ncbi:hypothetical protein [Pseudorhodoferax sp. Leaf267]|uniref:hypothetical protein n=1 Tax=Pseudorhodoferax sp. Leaf267 TaxID=1736316 RepID=UPI0006F33EA7|nr:hypothetical protein [Pseudorhodoferax sp. Leaf267]